MGSTQTRLRVVNKTDTDIISTIVSEVDDFDFDGISRPNRNFQGVYIASGDYAERREELRNGAKNCPFKMRLLFKNGLVDTFKINQKYAFGNGYWANFRHTQKSHVIDYDRDVDAYKVIITVKNTEQQLENQKVEEKNQEGTTAMRGKQHEIAMRKFDEASMLDKESSTIPSIKTNSTTTSTEDKSQEAQSKFDRASGSLKQGQGMRHFSDQQKKLKMDGTRLLHEGNASEKKAFQLFKNARKTNNAKDYNHAKNIYQEAMLKYEKAKTKFEEGAKLNSTNFGDFVKTADDLITETKRVIHDIDKIDSDLKITHATVLVV